MEKVNATSMLSVELIKAFFEYARVLEKVPVYLVPSLPREIPVNAHAPSPEALSKLMISTLSPLPRTSRSGVGNRLGEVGRLLGT